MDSQERKYWLDDPKNVRKLFWALCAICTVVFIADAFYEKHGIFAIEDGFAFYAIFGFIAYVGLIFAAKGLRKIVMRREDYYD